MTDVFISYKREERARCVAIYNALVDLKLSVWFDAHIEPGTSFDREIEREVRTAKTILVLWSELACDSDWIRAEARTGKQGERLVAARLDECLPPLEFASVQAVDLFDAGNFQSGEGWRQIVGRIGRLTGRDGLGDYVRCEQAADARLWQAWIAANGGDPLATKALERLSALGESGPVPGPAPTLSPAPSKPPSVLPVPDEGDSVVPTDAATGLLATLNPYRWPIAGAVALLVALLLWVNWDGSNPATSEPAKPAVGELAGSAPSAIDRTGGATEATQPKAADVAAGRADPKEKPAVPPPATKQVTIPDVSRLNCDPGPYIVFFEWDRSSLNPEAAGVLDLAVSRWRQCGGGRVTVAGHTDTTESAAYNVGLSQRMAASVQQYLEARGISGALITSQGFGESRPRVKTGDEVREAMNRRVEVTLRGN
jgi:outer membrane protein OmpA-like peptidoglycan-associated protein